MSPPHSRRGRRLALLLACIVAGGVAGAILDPPSEDDATVTVVALHPDELRAAGLAHVSVPAPAGAEVVAAHAAELGGAYVTVTSSDEPTALSAAYRAANDYAAAITARQNRVMAQGDPQARRTVLAEPRRFRLEHPRPSVGAGSASAALRGGLIGALAALLTFALLARAGPEGDRAPGPAQAAAALAAAGGLTALASVVPRGAYTFELLALAGLAALICAWRQGPAGIRALLVAAIAISPLRGGVLELADAIDLPNALLTFEALVPVAIAGCLVAAAIPHRATFREPPRLLVASWIVIAAVSALNFLVQDVGLKLYAVGLAQYMVYPTMALLAWPLIKDGDRERIVWLLAGVGVVVGISILLESRGVPFVEAAISPQPDGTGIRYGGVTGSYLHAAIYLGTTSVLVLTAAIARWSRRHAIIALGALAVTGAGLSLTYSRGGLAIAVIGGAAMLIALPRNDRLRIIALAVPAVGLALALAAAFGSNPVDVASHTSAAVSPGSDRGNSLRFTAMRHAFDHYRALPAKQKALGKGLGSTGNAAKLVSGGNAATESYPLKLLLEVGAIGLIAIGLVFGWAVLQFLLTVWVAADPIVVGAAAAGLGLSAEAAIYPTLEVQLLALTWWLLLALCLTAPAGRLSLRPPWRREATGESG